MSVTSKAYYGDGVTFLYPVTVIWAEPEFSTLEVLLDGVITGAFLRKGVPNPNGFTGEGVDIEFTVAPAEGEHIVVRRVTSIVPRSDFLNGGSYLTPEDLAEDQKQQFELMEENLSDSVIDTAHPVTLIGHTNHVTMKTIQEQLDDHQAFDEATTIELLALHLVDQNLQAQIDNLGGGGGGGTLDDDLIVSITNQGRYNSGDTILAGTSLQQIIIDMLQKDTPPQFTLSGLGTKTVETGSTVTPTMTGNYTANDAGPSNNYELFRQGLSIHINGVADTFPDTPFNIGDESIVYHAVLDYDENLLPAGQLTSNNITYRGARMAFYEAGGSIVNIRSLTGKTLSPSNGTNLSISGDSSSTRLVWSYPATLRDAVQLEHNDGSGGIYDLTPSITYETQQLVDDASGGRAILYKVVTYTSALPFNPVDTITLTI